MMSVYHYISSSQGFIAKRDRMGQVSATLPIVYEGQRYESSDATNLNEVAKDPSSLT